MIIDEFNIFLNFLLVVSIEGGDFIEKSQEIN